jgi:hypothetical protein
MAARDGDTPVIRLRLGGFEDFETMAGLLRDTGARREESRLFVIDRDMTIEQVAALVKLLEYSRQDANRPVKVEIDPPLSFGAYDDESEALYSWWGTVADWR